MRFLYRHQIFNELFYVYNPKKYGFSIKEISDNIIFNNLIGGDSDIESSNSIFILINNFDRIKPIKHLGDTFEIDENVQYLVMTKKEIINNMNNKKCNDSSFDENHKRKLMENENDESKIFKKILKSDIFDGKKNWKKDILKKKQQIRNESFENFSIFNDSFHSEKNWSSKI